MAASAAPATSDRLEDTDMPLLLSSEVVPLPPLLPLTILWPSTLPPDMRYAAVTVPLEEGRQLLKMSLWLLRARSRASRECITAMRWCCAVPVGSVERAETSSRDDASIACTAVWASIGGIGSGSTLATP